MAAWILLRGLVREQRHWGDFPAVFRRAVQGAQVFTPDLPGNGSEHLAASPASVAAMVEACRAGLHARGVHGPYRLLALSLGAMVAVEWCARYPNDIDRAVLVNTSMRPFSRFHQRLRWQNYPALAAAALSGAARERTILRLTSNRRGADQALLDEWNAIARSAPVARANAVRQLAAAARYRAPATPPAVPLLVLASRGDRLVDPCCSQRLAQAWQAPLRLHPDAGHDLPLDDGAWVARMVADWLAPPLP
jgi:pimeloyl-ACP methyl ester carboxylesterase